ncbi:MAG: hypothetical protein JEZ00_18080 [Anaerolineaceae bacterium]|nr:hypothetical protein [Anaerolineaceae bacterium]
MGHQCADDQEKTGQQQQDAACTPAGVIVEAKLDGKDTEQGQADARQEKEVGYKS